MRGRDRLHRLARKVDAHRPGGGEGGPIGAAAGIASQHRAQHGRVDVQRLLEVTVNTNFQRPHLRALGPERRGVAGEQGACERLHGRGALHPARQRGVLRRHVSLLLLRSAPRCTGVLHRSCERAASYYSR